MAAHALLLARGFSPSLLSSYGTSDMVRLPARNGVRAFPFGKGYRFMLGHLMADDAAYTRGVGLVELMSRNATVKASPESWYAQAWRPAVQQSAAGSGRRDRAGSDSEEDDDMTVGFYGDSGPAGCGADCKVQPGSHPVSLPMSPPASPAAKQPLPDVARHHFVMCFDPAVYTAVVANMRHHAGTAKAHRQQQQHQQQPGAACATPSAVLATPPPPASRQSAPAPPVVSDKFFGAGYGQPAAAVTASVAPAAAAGSSESRKLDSESALDAAVRPHVTAGRALVHVVLVATRDLISDATAAAAKAVAFAERVCADSERLEAEWAPPPLPAQLRRLREKRQARTEQASLPPQLLEVDISALHASASLGLAPLVTPAKAAASAKRARDGGADSDAETECGEGSPSGSGVTTRSKAAGLGASATASGGGSGQNTPAQSPAKRRRTQAASMYDDAAPLCTPPPLAHAPPAPSSSPESPEDHMVGLALQRAVQGILDSKKNSGGSSSTPGSDANKSAASVSAGARDASEAYAAWLLEARCSAVAAHVRSVRERLAGLEQAMGNGCVQHTMAWL